MPLPTPAPYKAPLHAFKRDPLHPPSTDVTGTVGVILFVTCILVVGILCFISGAATMDIHRQDQVAECEAKFSRACALVAIPVSLAAKG
jgi:hypothetical protein